MQATTTGGAPYNMSPTAARVIAYGAGDFEAEDVRFCSAFSLVVVSSIDIFFFHSIFLQMLLHADTPAHPSWRLAA